MNLQQQRTILFICTANAIRSQMAEAFVNYHNNGLRAYSAGIRPTRAIDKNVVKVMQEIGIDVSAQTVNSLEDYKNQPIDFAITLGSTAYQECPEWLYQNSLTDHWGFQDVSGRSKSSYRKLRDNIKLLIDQFLSEYSENLSNEELKELLKKYRI